MIPIDSIVIPERFVTICADWYGGQGCMLYAVCSTGNLTTGSIRPRNDDGEWASDEEWYYSLWCGLSADVAYARKMACPSNIARANGDDDSDYVTLTEFEAWIDDEVLPGLEASYGLEG